MSASGKEKGKEKKSRRSKLDDSSAAEPSLLCHRVRIGPMRKQNSRKAAVTSSQQNKSHAPCTIDPLNQHISKSTHHLSHYHRHSPSRNKSNPSRERENLHLQSPVVESDTSIAQLAQQPMLLGPTQTPLDLQRFFLLGRPLDFRCGPQLGPFPAGIRVDGV
jgi:hypothetical protein